MASSAKVSKVAIATMVNGQAGAVRCAYLDMVNFKDVDNETQQASRSTSRSPLPHLSVIPNVPTVVPRASGRQITTIAFPHNFNNQ